MDEKDFQDLLSEIDSMTVEEYNEFHEEALKMKESQLSIKIESEDKIIMTEDFYTKDSISIDSQFITNSYMKVNKITTNIGIKGVDVWSKAA